MNFIHKYLSNTGLKGKVARGSVLLIFGNSLEQGLRFTRNIILTRILAPEIFGVMAIVLAVNNAIETFTDIGIRYAVIQNPRSDDENFTNTAWWLSFIRSVVLYFIGYLFSPSIANFYANPDLIPLIRVAMISIIFNGALSTRAYVALKKMDMKKWAIVFHGGGALGVIITIVLSLFIRNIWALVFGLTAEAIIRCLISFLITPMSPRFHYDDKSFKEIISFSKGVFGLGFFFFIYIQSDIFFVGKLCTPYDLGLYSMAISLAQIPVQLVTQLIDKVGMSVFAQIQNDKSRLNTAMIDLVYYMALLGFPIISFIAIHGGEILRIIYGSTYAKVALPFAIIALSFLVRLMGVPIAQIYYAIGQPGLHRNFTILRAILILIFLYPAIRWIGLTGASLAGFVSMGIGLVFQLTKLHKITKYDWILLIRKLSVAVLIALMFIIVLYFSSKLLSRYSSYSILSGVLLCIILYIGIAIMLIFRKDNINSLNAETTSIK